MKTIKSTVGFLSLLTLLVGPPQSVRAADSTPEKVPFLGVVVESIDATLRDQLKLGRGAGVRVERVVPESGAAKAGLKAHDVLVKLNEQLVFNAEQLTALVRSLDTGDKVKLEVVRQGDRKKLDATLGETELKVADSEGRADPSLRIWDLQGTHPRVETWLHQNLEKQLKDHADAPDAGKSVTFLGVELAPVESALASQLGIEEESGALIRLVLDDSRAVKAGVKAHDVVTRIDGKTVEGPGDLTEKIRAHKKGDEVKLEVLRAGKTLELEATLSERNPARPTGMRNPASE